MKTEEIASICNPLGNLNARSQSHQKLQEFTVHQKPASPGRDVVETSTLNHEQLNHLERSNSDMHAFAQQVRKINSTLDTIEANLHQMRTALESIVKIYPPYPIGSTQREEALRQFSALRDIIDKLTIAPNQAFTERATDDPAASSLAEDGAYPLENPETTGLNVSLQSLAAGGKWLDVPNVSADFSDEQLNQVLKKTISAQEMVNHRRQEFNTEVNQTVAGMKLR